MVSPGSNSATGEKDDAAAAGLLDDIFAEEDGEDSVRLAAFADLEQLTMIEVAAETEAVLEELKIRQGG
ncbi:MAG: hypothetical protein HQ477_01215 [Chloroflexi bacterium]|jgi:hypothetical protein|nr:hypothetical protein [Chloroflexota bacterium]